MPEIDDMIPDSVVARAAATGHYYYTFELKPGQMARLVGRNFELGDVILRIDRGHQFIKPGQIWAVNIRTGAPIDNACQ